MEYSMGEKPLLWHRGWFPWMFEPPYFGMVGTLKRLALWNCWHTGGIISLEWFLFKPPCFHTLATSCQHDIPLWIILDRHDPGLAWWNSENYFTVPWNQCRNRFLVGAVFLGAVFLGTVGRPALWWNRAKILWNDDTVETVTWKNSWDW